MFEVNWTGSWPCLCHGEWIILKNGVNVSNAIPTEKIDTPMNTLGIYSTWYFDGWTEKWQSYESGLNREDWIAANPWINAICESEDEKNQLYWKIAKCDWRPGSCGGCI